MKAEHLVEAQKAVERIKEIDAQLRWPLTPDAQHLKVRHSAGSSTHLPLSHAVAAKALEMQKAELRARRAELVRRLNQLGVVL